MKRFEIKRVSESTEVTMGALIDLSTGVPLCTTLELPYIGNIKYESCIPTGIYTCSPYSSEKFKNVYEVMGVSGRDVILIHVGNTINDVNGCILLGSGYGEIKGLPAVTGSRDALNKFKGIVGEEKFTLIIS